MILNEATGISGMQAELTLKQYEIADKALFQPCKEIMTLL
jgi:hypothetical protein